MRKYFAGVLAVLFVFGLLFLKSTAVTAEEKAPAVVEVDELAIDDMGMDEFFDEAKVLRDAAAKLRTIAGDAEAKKLAEQLEELALDYEY